MINLVPNSCNVGTSECTDQLMSIAHEGESETNVTPVEGKTLPQDKLNIQQKISVADVMCTMCKQLLFHPVVLNCGHGTHAFKYTFNYILSKLSLSEHLS